MELDKKAVDVVDEIKRYNTLREFNLTLKENLYDIHRDEHKLKLLNLVSKKMKDQLDRHHSDGSCKSNYPNGGCPTDEKYENAFGYVEQEYDKIIDDINVYGSLNRFNADVFGEQFTIEKKNEISENIDKILNGQVLVLEGQFELNEALKEGFNELKELLYVLNKKSWTETLKGQILSSAIGLGINSENAISLIHNIEKAIM